MAPCPLNSKEFKIVSFNQVKLVPTVEVYFGWHTLETPLYQNCSTAYLKNHLTSYRWKGERTHLKNVGLKCRTIKMAGKF